MSKLNRHIVSKLCRALLVTTVVLLVSGPVWSAGRSIDIVINSLAKTDGQLSGKETYTLDEHRKLSKLKDAGEPALTDCLLDSWQTRERLDEFGLTVRKVQTAITRKSYELSWEADFTELPGAVGPLSAMSLRPSDRDREYEFSAAIVPPPSTTPVGPPVGDFTLTVTIRFPGTVQNNVSKPGKVDHTGESVSWTLDADALRSTTHALTTTVTPGRASEQRYWLVLMVSLTVVMTIVMVGILRRGARNAKRS